MESKYAMAWRYTSKKFPNGKFTLKGSFNEVPFEALKARRLLPEELSKVKRKSLYTLEVIQ